MNRSVCVCVSAAVALLTSHDDLNLTHICTSFERSNYTHLCCLLTPLLPRFWFDEHCLVMNVTFRYVRVLLPHTRTPNDNRIQFDVGTHRRSDANDIKREDEWEKLIVL